MKYILATDSFKGSLSSMEVEAEIAEVLTEKGADVVSLPMSDGGDGMLEAFTKALGGTIEPVYVHNQMMRRVDAAFGMTADGTAIVEVAQACGLELVKEDERNPMRATTYGVGELLSRAVKRGCRNFIIGLGGSGTSDAGIGMLRALVDIFAKGKTFDDAMQTELGECRFTLACDVDNPLCGENGAAYVYAPQRGLRRRWWSSSTEGRSCLRRSRLCITAMTVRAVLEQVQQADSAMLSCSILAGRCVPEPTCCSVFAALTTLQRTPT